MSLRHDTNKRIAAGEAGTVWFLPQALHADGREEVPRHLVHERGGVQGGDPAHHGRRPSGPQAPAGPALEGARPVSHALRGRSCYPSGGRFCCPLVAAFVAPWGAAFVAPQGPLLLPLGGRFCYPSGAAFVTPRGPLLLPLRVQFLLPPRVQFLLPLRVRFCYPSGSAFVTPWGPLLLPLLTSEGPELTPS